MRDDSELSKLVEMLVNGNNNSIYNFESNYWKQFSNKLYPGEELRPRRMIKWIMKTHAHERMMIRKQTAEYKSFDYTYFCNNNKLTFTFHNDMELNEDILILLYLHLAIKSVSFNTIPVQRILEILHTKYKIQNLFNSPKKSDLIERRCPVTIYRLTLLYPSISVNMFHQGLGMIANASQILFKEMPDLPRALCHHMIAAIIPHSVDQPPLALLIYIAMKYMSFIQNEIPSFITLYTTIVNLYESNVFPEELKMRLCMNWNIVMQYNTNQSISHTVTNYNEQAKDMLMTLMRNDRYFYQVFRNI